MKKSLIVALSAAFIFGASNVSEAAINNYPHRSQQEHYDSDYDYSRDRYGGYPSQARRQPPPPQYNPRPAPPFLTDSQKKKWRKQEAEREQWFDEARARQQRENQSQRRD